MSMSLRTITADSGRWVLLLRYNVLLLFLPYHLSQVLEPLNAFLLTQNTDTQVIVYCKTKIGRDSLRLTSLYDRRLRGDLIET